MENKICQRCHQQHGKVGLETFHGMHCTYCLPKEEIPRAKKFYADSRYLGHIDPDQIEFTPVLTCRHDIVGGCSVCYPNSYAGSPQADLEGNFYDN